LNDKYNADLPEKAQHYLSTISSAAKQMGTLIDDLLKFSRTSRQELRKTRFDMNVLFAESLDKIAPDVANRKIVWSIQELPPVIGDYSLLKQVWVNLLDNAVKYTRMKDTAEITVGFREENGFFIFFVRDNGVGFDMKYANKLFGVFQRLHAQSEFEGTGIGLANVQRIVFKHNGRVWAEAESNKGATFYFSLPKK
jgi:light-regulated signal transduction histidine kinase (bacteriophytochrome)